MRLITNLLLLILLTFCFPMNGQASIHVSAENAVLIEQSSGEVLFEKNAHEKSKVASITKMMTAIIAIESGKMNEKVVTSRRAIYTEGSSIYLEQGEKMDVEDLVYGLMLRSGNDAAVAISEHVGGSVEGFVYLMNEKARWLGMINTNFDNPHGLDSDNHYSTAYDMSLLLRYAMNNKTYQKIVGTTIYQAKERSYAWRNKNKLLSFYNYCTGGKTGYTKVSGRTLATTANKGSVNLIAVTLNAPDDWRDHMNMYEWGFNNYEMETTQSGGEYPYKLNETNETKTRYIATDIKRLFKRIVGFD